MEKFKKGVFDTDASENENTGIHLFYSRTYGAGSDRNHLHQTRLCGK